MKVRRLGFVAGVGAIALAAAGAGSGAQFVASSKATTGVGCPAGQVREQRATFDQVVKGVTSNCVPWLHPEDRNDRMLAARQLTIRHEGAYGALPGAFASAAGQAATIPGASGAGGPSWIPVGIGPEQFDVAGYSSVNSEGLHTASGRIQGLDYDPKNSRHWYAAIANGGVFETFDAGAKWRSIGENLPTQIVGHLAYDAPRHVLIAGTGDPAYGGDALSGLGIYRTTDDGKTWIRAKGVPTGTITFRIAVDPTNPDVVFAATGKGLWRSRDAGKSFINVVLPTGCTEVENPDCFFANMVTDVVVRGGSVTSGGGQVLAAVGWRAGMKLNAHGKPQAPSDGLYYSRTGKAHSFSYRSNAPGFTANKYVGRTALGIAKGPRQNHDYVYALVQDAGKFNGNVTTGDLPNPGAPNNTVLDGVYGSKDFGKTWTKLADADQLKSPANGSALNGPLGATYSPGVQAWYNEWIDVDPTTVADQSGTPSRLFFGLEEVWTGTAVIPVVPSSSQFTVIGQYFAGDTCAGLNQSILGYCPTNAKPGQKTTTATTHPDQHAEMFVPDRHGGVTLVVGNDGGAYKQHVVMGQDFDNYHWGNGINNGLQTLLPYYAAMAKDGTVVAGLQDNGNITITPEGKVIATHGGDGFFSFVDPDNSNIQYEEYVGGDISVSTDGGKSWTDINPVLTGALFSTPFTMDATNAKHLAAGGREIVETLTGPSTTSNTVDPNTRTAVDNQSWVKVYDLGTAQHPGDATAGRVVIPGVTAQGSPLSNDVDLRESAIDIRGNAAYVGYCGYCDIVTQGIPFKSGIATNVGGSVAPKAGTSAGWHIAKAIGLPQRIVNSIASDPKNPRTVYVALGGYARRWIPPGKLGDDISKVGSGHVFVSHDAGEHFTDISGNLPDLSANWVLPHNGSVLVATDLGAYIGAPVKGAKYRHMGKALPYAPVFSLSQSPRNPNEIIAATYGRGVYRIVLGSTSSSNAKAAAQAARANESASVPTTSSDTASARKTLMTSLVSSSSPPVLVGLAVMVLGVAGAVCARRLRRSGSSG